MKSIYTSIFIVFALLFSTLNTVAQENDDDYVFTVVKQMPEFPGGTAALNEYLKENLVYPTEDSRGVVYITFVVTKEGDLIDPKIVRGKTPEMNQSALDVIKDMPAWIPGQQKKENVNVQFYLQVRFTP